ncbi:macrolide family glycosyltransferase [Rhodococcus sp. NPDC058521]|uniref:macrolide family glycosyltransferase n=1 Tax=Rhodococcus sp. NPDC058521 TaxID=3346536 RepID=UPI003653E96A
MPRKHIAMVSIPAPGHVNPSLEIIRELVDRGHRVTYANDPSMEAVITATGAELRPVVSTLPKVNHSGVAEESTEKSWDGDAIHALTLFQEEYESMLPQLRDHYEDDRPDLFLYDIAGGPARILAQEWGIPMVQLSPTYVAWEGYEEDMAPMLDEMKADPRGAAYYERQARFLVENGVSMPADQFYGRPERAVVLVAKSMQPNAERVNESVYTFVGPALPTARSDDGEWARPAGNRKILLISLGTAYTDKVDFYRRCMEAFGGLDDWHVVLQIGRYVDPNQLGDVPANFEVHRWVPQFDILGQADAFVTHAGMGGSSEGMFTGTPMIAVPQAVDQFENADALVAAGVGVRLDADTATVAELRTALGEVTSEPIRGRSAELAAELREAGGAARAVEIIEAAVPS